MRASSLLCAMLVSLSVNPAYAEQGCPNQPVAKGLAPDLDVGYLAPQSLPDSKALLPTPPAKDSAGLAADEIVSMNSLELRCSKRWNLAIQDAALAFPDAAGTFSCALGVPITERETPHLYTLLRRSLADAAHSTDRAKAGYHRKRPFVANRLPTCTPDDERFLVNNGSYPSGHSAIGWTWALILAEVAPERIDAILARGLAFGESRVICNAHWESDVVAGRVAGAGAVARLHADHAFRKDLEAAKREYLDARQKGLRPRRDCAAEAEALAK